MQNNYYFLRQLSPALAGRLDGFSVVSCFSQNKDELVMEFNNAKTSFFIRADLSADLCCLSFPGHFSRAGKNSVDLFPEIVLKKVSGVRQFENERSFSINLEDDLHVVFKMHGTRANVVVYTGEHVSDVFRHHLIDTRETTLQNIDRTIDWSKDYFMHHQDSLQAAYFTFGKHVWNELRRQGFETAAAEERWNLIRGMLEYLEDPDFRICKDGFRCAFLLFPSESVIKKFSDPISGVTEFYSMARNAQTFYAEKEAAVRKMHSLLTGATSFIQKNTAKLQELGDDMHYKVWADLIMANMHRIKAGSASVVVENLFDDNKPLEIPLKQTLSPQKNAELFYRKSRNKEMEIKKLREAIQSKESERLSLLAGAALLEQETTIRGLRQNVEGSGLEERTAKKQAPPLPYREVEFRGFKIWIGRNAESNDKLTQKFSFKDDLWLHAKDVAGSHVLLKHQSGKVFPKDVIERAAQLAAWYSKRKNEKLCPVAYTLRKYVRKRKGSPAGTVVVEREDVLLVEPTA